MMGDLHSPSTSITLNEEGPLIFTPSEESTSNPRCFSLLDTEYQNEALYGSNLPPLDAQDLELLTHYLTHTSQVIPYDKADLYALHIGIPNLAFSSKPLMSSMLALAAACKCYDLLPGTAEQCMLPLSQIQDLLQLAEKHHRSSLHQIQQAIGTARYDTVLANATLMTLYGSAVHCVRIRLINFHKEARLRGPIPSEFFPAHTQWINLIRAVNSAFIGLQADVEVEGTESSASPSSSLHDSGEQPECRNAVGEVKCSQDGPAESTRRFFLPIVTETIGRAMESLRARVQNSQEAMHSTFNIDIRVCTGALEELESIVAEIIPGVDKKSTTRTMDKAHDGFIGRLALVTPWVRAYTARVTSNNDSGQGVTGPFTSYPLRRKITAFLNRVDAGFLRLVQEMLESTSFPELGETGRGSKDESAASQCAMDIFAHWLVLMCLLDGVWWIGGIGMWELGRVVNYTKESDGAGGAWEEEAWWPASMYTIRMELAKQRV